jgi:hypothetical protein
MGPRRGEKEEEREKVGDEGVKRELFFEKS